MAPTLRSFRHWTPRYLADRMRDRLYQAAHPEDPWLTPLAIQFLSAWLQKTDRGLEFGSGRSTLWFARRVASLTSIEHSPAWYERIRQALQAQGRQNVDYRLIEDQGKDRSPAYVAAAADFQDNSLDFVLVDGITRDACANASICKIRSDGLLIIDDVHRYLPSRSISPYARTLAQGPATPDWGLFLEKVQSWRCLWTSKGVSDTAIYFKP